MIGKMPVLIVDDHVFILDLLSEVLAEGDFLTTTAKSGEEALEIFRKSPFPLVISDIHMGGISGLDVLVGIKEMAPQAQVIIMSSDASDENFSRAIDLGASEFMTKPFVDLSRVAKVIGRVADKARAQNSLVVP